MELFSGYRCCQMVEAVGFSLACYPDEALEKTADEVIDLIADAQCEDGYINTYFTIKEQTNAGQTFAKGTNCIQPDI